MSDFKKNYIFFIGEELPQPEAHLVQSQMQLTQLQTWVTQQFWYTLIKAQKLLTQLI